MADPMRRVVTEIAGEPFHVFFTPEDGLVRAAGFASQSDSLAEAVFARLGQLDPALARRSVDPEPVTTGQVAEALHAYASGSFAELNELPVSQPATPFRSEVWQQLRNIPPGGRVSYTDLATMAGNPRAVRAAASACANNLVALIVPCHRVVRSDGSLGGYLFGVELKARLLEFESAAGVNS